MRILLWSLIKFLLHQHCLKFFAFIFVTLNTSQSCLNLPCLSRTFWRCVSQVFQCQLQGNIPSSSCEKIFSKFGRQDAFWGSFDTGSRIIHIEILTLEYIRMKLYLHLGLCHSSVLCYKLYILVCEDLASVSTAHGCVVIFLSVDTLTSHDCSGLLPGWDWQIQCHTLPASSHQQHQHHNTTTTTTTPPQHYNTGTGPCWVCGAGGLVVLVLCKKYESIMVIDLTWPKVLLVFRLLNIILIGQFYRLTQ